MPLRIHGWRTPTVVLRGIRYLAVFGKRQSSIGPTSNAEIDQRYWGWDPVIALRDALRRNPTRAEERRAAWTSWLRERGVHTAWLRRLSVDDPRGGVVTVAEEASDYIVPSPVLYGVTESPRADTPLRLSSSGARYWTARAARVVGGWDVVRTREGACWPALTPRDESFLVSNALDARLLGWTPSFMIVRDDARARRPGLLSLIRERVSHLDHAIALVGEHSFQYGHWLGDYLPRALAVRELPTSVPILIDASVPENSRWWLEKVLPGRPTIELEPGAAVDVDTLFVPLQRTFCPTGWIDSMEMSSDVWSADPSAVAQMQNLAMADAPAPIRHRRLWLGRRGGNRPLLNQQELFETMVPHGFSLLYAEDYSMDGLQSVLDETKDIIAPLGSQILNVLAARPGLRVLVLLGDVLASVRGWVVVAPVACGHELGVAMGDRVGEPGRNPYEDAQRPFTVSPQVLEVAHASFFGDR